jgi:hypothetical protein
VSDSFFFHIITIILGVIFQRLNQMGKQLLQKLGFWSTTCLRYSPSPSKVAKEGAPS